MTATPVAQELRTIRIATRPSPLALAQAAIVAGLLAAGSPAGAFTTEIVVTRTTGDTDRRDLSEIAGTGVFVGAVRDAVLGGRADVAVHSAKDLPVGAVPGLLLAATPTREDVGDVLALRAADAGTAAGQLAGDPAAMLAGLSKGARIGTGSPRRAAALRSVARAAGLAVEVVGVRGNVDTRLGLVAAGRLDAVVVAAAGLARLGRPIDAEPAPWDTHGALTFRRCPLAVMLPAPAQGALAIECRADAPEWLRTALAACDDPATGDAVAAERAVLAALDAGCSTPVGALALLGEPGRLLLEASLADSAGSISRVLVEGPADDPRALGARAATGLRAGLDATPHRDGSDFEEGAS